MIASWMAVPISSASGGHVRDRLDVAGRDAAAVGAYDAAEEGGVLVVLDDAPSPVWCQGAC